jgi:hypothetical protein
LMFLQVLAIFKIGNNTLFPLNPNDVFREVSRGTHGTGLPRRLISCHK